MYLLARLAGRYVAAHAALLLVLGALFPLGVGVFHYAQHAALVGERLSAGAFSNTIDLYAEPVRPSGQPAPELITNISKQKREKRQLVRFSDLPKHLVDAVVSIEDKRFFEHDGFDLRRIVKSAYVDLKESEKKQGASTLTMQLARSFWLHGEKSWRRKLSELLIAIELERKLSKHQIFECYADEIYLGQHGTFAIHGFGAAARAYFGKNVRELSLPEAATLAGMAQRPTYYNPLRNPEAVVERRNHVLAVMRENGKITDEDYRTATRSPLHVSSPTDEVMEAPYFVDMVRSEVQSQLANTPAAHRVYVTLDRDLQRAAEDAVRAGGPLLDAQIRKRRSGEQDTPQIALVALDPRSGAIRALVGGRNYISSQLNRAVAKRQPGSAFKPFVYAAAFNTGLNRDQAVFTPASILTDEPTTFQFGGEQYEPGNFGGGFYGDVTLRRALTRSLNVVTVKLAQGVGYEAVADLARQAGFQDIAATPSLALGSYDATALELAAAYTVFANHGVYVEPYLISAVRSPDGRVLHEHSSKQRPVLDPRVSYMVVNLLESVVQAGTASGVRARGFRLPVAGKTGTSRDGWFVGFTSELVCAVWVGFDDHHDLGLEGGKSALPIWTEFMKRAAQLAPYRNATRFDPPPGLVSREIDRSTGMLATPWCTDQGFEIFLAGTQPTEMCNLHSQPPDGGLQIGRSVSGP